MNIYGTLNTANEDSPAIYHPQYGIINIYDGTEITGGTGIEMRAGELTMTGGTVTGNASPTSEEANNNGSTTKGAGISVSQHTTKLVTKLNITGGSISGHTALYQTNVQGNDTDARERVEMSVSGGDFSVINGGTNVLYSDNFEGFVSGGTFSKEFDTSYLQPGLKLEADGSGGFTTIDIFSGEDGSGPSPGPEPEPGHSSDMTLYVAIAAIAVLVECLLVLYLVRRN